MRETRRAGPAHIGFFDSGYYNILAKSPVRRMYINYERLPGDHQRLQRVIRALGYTWVQAQDLFPEVYHWDDDCLTPSGIRVKTFYKPDWADRYAIVINLYAPTDPLWEQRPDCGNWRSW